LSLLLLPPSKKADTLVYRKKIKLLTTRFSYRELLYNIYFGEIQSHHVSSTIGKELLSTWCLICKYPSGECRERLQAMQRPNVCHHNLSRHDESAQLSRRNLMLTGQCCNVSRGAERVKTSHSQNLQLSPIGMKFFC
jgi:hypothetical protein